MLKNLNFVVKPGEKIGVIGRTGAGKSSLVKVILRFLDNIEGKVILKGINVLDQDIRVLRREIYFIS